ncbi:hypothetical protein [Paraliobacillus ryukyuensis]|uniref:hypothetical protein n=1 Tax=Paraliobacillus ryukyuensis TaxID=200904 RepID=UPI0009A72DE9|nr:hypothetical protein [Paraliobacillus ryukyuensis]
MKNYGQLLVEYENELHKIQNERLNSSQTKEEEVASLKKEAALISEIQSLEDILDLNHYGKPSLRWNRIGG